MVHRPGVHAGLLIRPARRSAGSRTVSPRTPRLGAWPARRDRRGRRSCRARCSPQVGPSVWLTSRSSGRVVVLGVRDGNTQVVVAVRRLARQRDRVGQRDEGRVHSLRSVRSTDERCLDGRDGLPTIAIEQVERRSTHRARCPSPSDLPEDRRSRPGGRQRIARPGDDDTPTSSADVHADISSNGATDQLAVGNLDRSAEEMGGHQALANIRLVVDLVLDQRRGGARCPASAR